MNKLQSSLTDPGALRVFPALPARRRRADHDIGEESGPGAPMRVTAFHPDYGMLDKPRTAHETLAMARQTAPRNGMALHLCGQCPRPQPPIDLLPRLRHAHRRPGLAPIATNFWLTIIGGTGIAFELETPNSVAMSNENRPAIPVPAFWALAMAAMAMILVATGSGGAGKLQSFIVVTAVPVSLILLPSLWDAARITLAKGKAAVPA